MFPSIGHFRNINIQLDSEAERTKTIETSCNEVKDTCISISSTFLLIGLCPLNLSFKLNFIGNISKVAYSYNVQTATVINKMLFPLTDWTVKNLFSYQFCSKSEKHVQ